MRLRRYASVSRCSVKITSFCGGLSPAVEGLLAPEGRISPSRPASSRHLASFSAASHCERNPLHVPQDADLGLQFGDRTGSRGLIKYLLGGLLLLVRRQILQVFQFVRVQLDAGQHIAGRRRAAAA